MMSSKAKKTAPVKKAPLKKKAAKGYKLPDPIRSGEIVKDLMKKEWQIGPSIGVGGFGEIYSATDVSASPRKKASYPYVVKIEPHINGPLFVEMHFYMKVAKPADVEAWMRTRKLKSFGMPRYLGSGSHEYNGQKYRFVVMDRYGKDLWSLFLENNRIFPYATVLRIALQVIDVLEYIHSKTYVHADIKGSNLLLGLQKGTENQVFLVDFGLASHFTEKEFKPDPKKAHNGTIEYASRDAHSGVPTMRGDLEILGYNLLQWLASKLPWEDSLSNPMLVHQQKMECMDDIKGLMKKCFPKSFPPAALVKYFEYVASLKHNDSPDYTQCRKLLEKGLKDCKCSKEGKLDFSSKVMDRNPVQKQSKATSAEDEESSVQNVVPVKRTRRKDQTKTSKKNIDNISDSDVDSAKEEQHCINGDKQTRRRKQANVTKEDMNNLTSDSDSDSDSEKEQKIDKKRTQRRKQAHGAKGKVNNLVSDSGDDSGKEQQRHVNQVDKSKFVYRAGEYKRLPPELRPYKLKKPKKNDS